MALKSILDPSSSVMLGLANGGVVLAIYSHSLPNSASVRVAEPHDHDIEATRKAAAWTSFGVLSLVFLLTRDKNSFFIGAMALGAIDYVTKHSNGYNPSTKSLHGTDAESLSPELSNVYPIPDYSQEA